MTVDLEKSFKTKLKNIAREANRDPADLWQSVVLERFLARLGRSPHRHYFVLKGGVLLAKYSPSVVRRKIWTFWVLPHRMTRSI